METRTTIKTIDLCVGYRRGRNTRKVLSNIDIKAESGTIISLIGANGSGKSTLIKTLAGLLPSISGQILLNSKDLGSLTPVQIASQVSMVLTDRIFSGYLTVSDLVALGRHPYTDWRGRLGPSDVDAVLDALRVTDLSDLKHHDLQQLSDGQRQKAMIARAVAQDGEIMLLDEPLIHLDVPSKWEIMSLLRQMAHTRSKTIILATHELDLSMRISDQIWLIEENGQVQTGTPEDLVLNGKLSAVFDSKDYYFDINQGGFTTSPKGTKVRVSGIETLMHWTRRALERKGFQAVSEKAEWEICCTADSSGHHWLLSYSEVAVTCNSIGELIDSLNKATNKTSHAGTAGS